MFFMLKDEKTINQLRIELFVVSCIVLLQELSLIRYIPGQVRVLAYFPNLILLSAFLGLGVGCLRAGKSSLLWLWPTSLLIIILCCVVGSRIAFTQESVSEHLWLLYYDLPANAKVFHGVKLPIIIGFLLSCISFIPLGQIVADRLQQFKKLSSSLWGYCWDISGSLFGIIIFSILGIMQIFPVIWFLIFFLAGFLFFYKESYLNIAYIVAVIVICSIISMSEKAMYYSPYYSISYEHTNDRVSIMTNGSLHQVALHLNNNKTIDSDEVSNIREGYHLPYKYFQKRPQKALVLGAGTGNDVSVMLDEGVEHIDAIEIDPVLIEIGRKHHPDLPYSSSRVNIFNTDARSFLNHTSEQYDLIVFGTLDSMTRLSALSNVRLDNFMYTIECINKAKQRLKPDGGLVMYFMTATPYIHNKLISLLTSSFNQLPLVITNYYNLFNNIYMSGPAFDHHDGYVRKNLVSSFKEQVMNKIYIPTDDWPYLYLESRGISSFYISLISIIMLIALLLIIISSGDMRESIITGKKIDIQMFFFGFAFLLLETRYVTQMNLVWGATWITSAVVFGSILFMVLISTITACLHPIPFKISFFCLLTALTLTYLLPVDLLLQQNIIIKLLISILFVGIPIFFAGNCFAFLFEKRERVDIAFGWNLIGAVIGGLTEFLTMIVGFRSLLLLTISIYLLALLFYIREMNEMSDEAGSYK
ncbi:MAG: hypothetical protein HQK77_02020 [Desulfobacterales bacterium]|nr:hypothetical protein [Desulfobacterales bacterium]